MLFFAGWALGNEGGSFVLFFDSGWKLGFAAVAGFVLALHAPRAFGCRAGLAGFEGFEFVHGVLVALGAVQGNGFWKVHANNRCSKPDNSDN